MRKMIDTPWTLGQLNDFMNDMAETSEHAAGV